MSSILDEYNDKICVCCLRVKVPLVNLSTCKHAGHFARLFHYKTYVPITHICCLCHSLFVKFVDFKKAVEHNICVLNNAYIKNSSDTIEPFWTWERTPIELSYATDFKPIASKEVEFNNGDWLERNVATNLKEDIWTDQPLENKTTLLANEELNIEIDIKQEVDEHIEYSDEIKQEKIVGDDDDDQDFDMEVEHDDDSNSADFEDAPLARLTRKKKRKSLASRPSRLVKKKCKEVKEVRQSKRESLINQANTSQSEPEPQTATTNTPHQPKILDERFEGKVKVITLTREEYLAEKELERNKESYKRLPFRCDDCAVGFDHEATLQEHMEKRHTKMVYDGPETSGGTEGHTETAMIEIGQTDPFTIKSEPEDEVLELRVDHDDPLDLYDTRDEAVTYFEGWNPEKTFYSFKKAEEYVKLEHGWKKMDTSVQRTMYTCSRKTKNGICHAKILIHTEKQCCYRLYRFNVDHTCNFKGKKCKLTKEMKEVTEQIYHNKPPRQIKEELEKMFDKVPKVPLYNYIKSLKVRDAKKTSAAVPIAFKELKTWLQDNTAIPDTDDSGFVLNYTIRQLENENTFRFILSTKRLIETAIECDDLILHMNLTHRLLWYNYPFILVGMTDRNQEFHLIALAVCSDVTADDFEFIFKSLKDVAASVFDEELTPKVLVADTSEDIKKGFKTVFPKAKIRTCWNQMSAILQKDLPSRVHGEELTASVLQDISFIQSLADKEDFSVALKLFFEKWHKSSFVRYFRANWIEKHFGWHESYCPGTPCTNESLEWASYDLKNKHNLPERLEPKRFCSLLKDILEGRSKRYKDGRATVATSVLIDNKMWGEGYDFSLTDNALLIKEGVKNVYLIKAADKINMDLRRAKSFDDYVQKRSTYHKVVLPKEKKEWMEGKCTCSKFMKAFICEHLCGLAIKFNHVETPKIIVQRKNYAQRKKMRQSEIAQKDTDVNSTNNAS